MRTEISYSPAYAAATIHLDHGESVSAEAGAMLAMTPTVQIATSTKGGMIQGLKRSVLGGESFFLNTYTANGPDARVMVAPALVGDVITWPLTGNTVFVQSGSYLAAPDTITIDSKWGGSRTFFSKEGLFMLKCAGVGDLLVSSYGAIHQVDLAPGETYIVDTGHMVGWEETVTYEVQRVGGLKSTILGGEGLVVKLTGPGRAYVQTRSPTGFLDWLIPKLPTQRS
jgi:uncharacterized protein (TIGR00266 family)